MLLESQFHYPSSLVKTMKAIPKVVIQERKIYCNTRKIGICTYVTKTGFATRAYFLIHYMSFCNRNDLLQFIDLGCPKGFVPIWVYFPCNTVICNQGFQPNSGIKFHDFSRNISVFPGYKYRINMHKKRLVKHHTNPCTDPGGSLMVRDQRVCEADRDIFFSIL